MIQRLGIILGSGLTQFSEELYSPKLIHEDHSSFHKLKIFSGKINDCDIILFSGRRHFYEGYSIDKVLENINIAKELGVNNLIITNAAGGLNKNFNVSDLMLITSHLNFLTLKIPKNNSQLYTKETLDDIRVIAKKEKINLKYGCYCCAYGPMYESRSEIRFLTKRGVDAVGMSTVPEIFYANKLGIKTLAFSCITNILSEHSQNITNHEEVVQAGKNAYSNFSKLLKAIISKI